MNIFLLATAIEPDRSLEFTSTVVIAGLGTVLAALAVLIIIFFFFGKGVSSAQERAKKKNEKENPAPVIPDISEMLVEEALPPIDDGVTPEIVAAISAAVYAYEGKDAKITSIKRKPVASNARKAWAQAAVVENTRPF